ncbi:MAG TPA: hypothetical protein VJK54_01090, partial [Chthoniobacterales bacterium]|nr:hypothetical protein [Chthoniobacterales bacterium]
MKSSTKFLLSSIVILNATSLLAMDIGKGAEALGEELGVFGKRVTSDKTSVVATAVASPVGSSVLSVSSAMVSGQRAVVATAAVISDETGEENSAAQFLEKEICDNIYLGCLAKVTTMSLSARASAEGIAQEAKEWAAAEQKAKRDVEKSQQALEAATEEKKIIDKEIKMMLDDRTFHAGAIVTKAYRDFKIKELAEQLAKTRVETARATLYAIQVKGTAQSVGAETDLTEAITGEKFALQALEEAKVHATENTSMPIAEAVAVEAFAVYPDHHSYPYNQHFSPLNVSPERSAQERQEEVLVKKEKAAAAFETEFAETIREAKAQVEEAAEVAEAAREKAEKQGTSEKVWNKAIEEAEIAEEAYAHLGELYEMYQEEASKHYEGGVLKTKCSKYKFELTKAEKKKNHWTAEVEECRQKKESLKHGEAEKALEQQRAIDAKAAQEREVVRIAEQERARLESERKAEFDRLESARVAELARIEREQKAEADRLEAERIRKQAEEQAIAEKKAAQEREEARLAEQARAERERQAVVEKARIAEQARIEKERQAAAEKARLEAEKKEAAEKARVAEQARIEKERKTEADRIEQERVRRQAEEKAAAEKALKEKQEFEKKAAEERAGVAEQARIEKERKAEADRIEAERAKKQAEEKAAIEKAKVEAEKKAAQEREAARFAEQVRVDKEKQAAVTKARQEEEVRKKAAADLEARRFQELAKNLPPQSTEAAKGVVAPVLEASSSSCTL